MEYKNKQIFLIPFICSPHQFVSQGTVEADILYPDHFQGVIGLSYGHRSVHIQVNGTTVQCQLKLMIPGIHGKL